MNRKKRKLKYIRKMNNYRFNFGKKDQWLNKTITSSFFDFWNETSTKTIQECFDMGLIFPNYKGEIRW